MNSEISRSGPWSSTTKAARRLQLKHDLEDETNPDRAPWSSPGAPSPSRSHHGLHSTIDLTYASLGAHLAATDELRTGPVREHYLVTDAGTPDNTNWQTEICWPVP